MKVFFFSRQFPEDPKIISRFRVNWSLMKFTPEFLEQAKFKESIKSESFEIVAGRIKTKWWIRFCPNGDYKEKMFAIYLMKQEESSQNYDINCRFSFMNGDQELHFFEMRTLRAAEIEVNSGRGVGEFLTHEEFVSRWEEFVKGSELRIRTEVKLTAPISEGELYLNHWLSK